ncbi:hypothetical protein FOM02_35850 [Bradyrhizobium sp. SEMIA]|nr:hypothetical protein FOM02_35850 [Bradyrhizobium sp. SEMIA]
MRPQKHRTTGSGNLFLARLNQIVNMKHARFSSPARLGLDRHPPLYSENGRRAAGSRARFERSASGHTSCECKAAICSPGGRRRQLGILRAWLKTCAPHEACLKLHQVRLRRNKRSCRYEGVGLLKSCLRALRAAFFTSRCTPLERDHAAVPCGDYRGKNHEPGSGSRLLSGLTPCLR